MYRRLALAAAAALIAVAFRAPLWTTSMESPQYRGEEVLRIAVHADRIAGSLREIETLNQYVGVRIPREVPELDVGPFALGALLLVALGAALAPAARLRRAAAVVSLLLAASLAAGAALAQYRLYRMGHDRGRTPFARVEDFTPPVVGVARIANFEVRAGPGIGGLALVLAAAAAGCAALPGRRHRSAAADPRMPLAVEGSALRRTASRAR